ncbi:hypothetical protein F4Y59_07080 [Candidatus Poribacteria bacterium]|nr:hypothetical protein [Candidatus Poribacteria bacterium]MXY27905.1 hypothetical protein [Candidatus Poribacteria bacterium]MYK20500.1 hypothetical protein [Candidatus Poribacteria bacterium]
MPEFISSPTFLIIAAILGIFLLIRVSKGMIRLILWVVLLFLILIGLGFGMQEDLRDWIENLIKRDA